MFLIFGLVLAAWLSGCDTEGQVVRFQIQTLEWATPSTPVAGVRVVLEEQRLNNGVVNAFYTELEEANTDASGMVELETVRSNVLSIRVRAEKEGCFTEIVELNPETLSTATPNAVEVVIMPQCFVQAELDNTNSPCPGTNTNYKWTPRDVTGAASDVRWTCDTDWQDLKMGR